MSYEPRLNGDRMHQHLSSAAANGRRAKEAMASCRDSLVACLDVVRAAALRPTLNPVRLAEMLVEIAEHGRAALGHAQEAARLLRYVEDSVALAEQIRLAHSEKAAAAREREAAKREGNDDDI